MQMMMTDDVELNNEFFRVFRKKKMRCPNFRKREE